MLHVAEVLRHRKPRQSHAHTYARGLVHLTEYQRGLVGNSALAHFVPEVVTLTAALADAGEYRVTAVLHRNVVDKLLNKHRLADARAAEQTYLTALGVRLKQVYYLDTGLEHLSHRLLLLESRSLAVYLPALAVGEVALAVYRLAEYVEHAP